MGSSRTVGKRKLINHEKEYVVYIDHIFRAINDGFVTLPRQLWHYRNAIHAGYAGVLDRLYAAIANVEKRADVVKTSDSDSDVAIKFKGGMAAHFLNIHVVLSVYREALTEYWRLVNASSNQIRVSPIGHTSKYDDKIFSGPGPESHGRCVRGSRERI